MRILPFVLALAACQVPAPRVPLQPADAAASTFKVTAESLEGEWYGTAWIVDNSVDRTLLVTAGHVCEDAFAFTLKDRYSGLATATVVSISEKYDLCLLSAAPRLGPALAISPAEPEYGETVWYVGAPKGIWGCQENYRGTYCGLAPIEKGWYAGGDLVSLPSTGGASGSAILTSRGVVGVLVAGYRVYDSLTFMETRAHLVEFIR